MSEQNKGRYELVPCSGIARLGIPRGHVYDVRSDGQSVGFGTLEAAERVYGRENIAVSSTDTLCSLCESVNLGKVNIEFIPEA